MTENKKKLFRIIFAVTIIVIGILILIQKNFHNANVWIYIWPFIPVVLGFMMIRYADSLNVSGKKFFCIFGSMVSMAGLLLLFSIITNYWKIWYYGWTLIIPISYGIGKNIVGLYSKEKIYRGQGNRTIFLGVIFFILGFGIYEYMFQFNRIMENSFSKITLGYIFVCFGIYLLVPRQFNSKSIFDEKNWNFIKRREESEEEIDEVEIATEKFKDDDENETTYDGDVEDFLTK
ncbi:MAG: hypothetical protein KAH01_03245 [Caldisericia bacterium]|nr:hypothetical protein [Caldisericia bacterium]